MPDLTSSLTLGFEESGKSPPAAALATEGEWLPDVGDYVTPPPKQVMVVAVRYGAAVRGAPMPYDLAEADDGP